MLIKYNVYVIILLLLKLILFQHVTTSTIIPQKTVKTFLQFAEIPLLLQMIVYIFLDQNILLVIGYSTKPVRYISYKIYWKFLDEV